MSLINVTNIKIGNNVCNIKLPLIFQIEFECLEHLKHDVEWKVIYITSDGSGYINTNNNNTSNTNNSNHITTHITNTVDITTHITNTVDITTHITNTVDITTHITNTVDNTTHITTTNTTTNTTTDTTDTTDNEKEYLISNNKGEIILDAVCLGPLYKGILEFEFRVNPPNFHRLNPECILGMQAILISGNYCDQEFIRIGYYTNNVYDEESLVENPPDLPILDKIVRCIIDQPRVTRFPIKWDNDYLVDFEGNNLNFIINTESDDNTITPSSNTNELDNTSNTNELDNTSNTNIVDNTSNTNIVDNTSNSSGTSEDSTVVPGTNNTTEEKNSNEFAAVTNSGDTNEVGSVTNSGDTNEVGSVTNSGDTNEVGSVTNSGDTNEVGSVTNFGESTNTTRKGATGTKDTTVGGPVTVTDNLKLNNIRNELIENDNRNIKRKLSNL